MELCPPDTTLFPDSDDLWERKTGAETNLGRQDNHARAGVARWKIDCGKVNVLLAIPFSAWFDIKYACFISLFWNMSMLDIAILFNVACDHHYANHVVILQIGFSRGYQQGWHAFLRANVFKMSFIVLAGKRGLISTCSHVQHAT